MDLLETTCGALVDALTDVERRVTSWEHDGKEKLSDLIKIGVVIKGLEKGGFRDHLLINTAGTTEWTTLVKEIENVDLTRRNTQPAPMDLSALDSQDRKLQENCSWCGIYGHMARDGGKKIRRLATHTNKWKVWHGRQRQRQARHGQRAKASKTRASLAWAKARTKTKERVNTTARKGRKDFPKWRDTSTRKTHKPVKIAPNGQTDTDWWSSDWSTDLWASPAWAPATCSRTVQSNARRQHFNVRWTVDVRVVS